MRRWCLLGAALALCLFGGCRATASVVGTWATEDPDGYTFRLTEDGRCVMLNAADEWVSDGVYTVDDDYLYFETDTGDFTWLRTEDGMLFRANGHELY